MEFDGRMWVPLSNAVVQLDPVSLRAGTVIDLEGFGPGVLEVEGGALWVRAAYGTARLDIQTGTMAASNDRTYDSLATVGGRLFGTSDADLYEIDPATAEDLGQVVLPPNQNGSEYEVVWTPLVADGETLWVTVGADGWQFTAWDPASGLFGTSERIVVNTIAAVLVGDRIWLSDRYGEITVLDTATGEEVDVDITLPIGDTILDSVGSLFAGPDRSLWLLDQPQQMVFQLDPHTGATLGSFHLGSRPSTMTVTATDLWIADFDERVTVLPRSALTAPAAPAPT
ncbi:MAG: hypothetical protein Q7V88_15980 [Actinomycetota bacterium]|nr:hypothetical protein [Actinomycetota bacterium]